MIGDSPEEKVTSWLARIIAADNWKPSANSNISSSAIDFMDMYVQLLELSIKAQGKHKYEYDAIYDSENIGSSSSSSSFVFSPQELVKQVSPEVKEKLSDAILRYCRLVSRSMCEGLVCREIEYVQEHMNNYMETNEKHEKRRSKIKKVKMIVPGPLPPECCIKCNNVDHIICWATENDLCTEEDMDLLVSCLKETKTFLSSWCAVYPCHIVRRALKWRKMKPVSKIGDYLDVQLCAMVSDLKPRIFTGVAARIWDSIMQETVKYTKVWNKRKARKIVMMTFDYFYAGGDGLSARTLENSSSFQRLKEYLQL